ncbi:MAG: Gfo/Idh/MocA family protein [Phycisphaerae bacterium]
MSATRIVGVSFDHMHIGDLLRLAKDHPDAQIVGVWHHEPNEPHAVLERLGLDKSLYFADFDEMMRSTKPDMAIVCAATARHAQWTVKLADYGVHVLVEKPFAANLADADAMTAATRSAGKKLAINWPLAWYPPHRTTRRLLEEGLIGELIEVHYYDGNRGPVRHKMDKVEVSDEAELLRQKQTSWWYKKSESGGSLQDYLGYGATLGTWFNGGKKPLEVTCTAYVPDGLEVDEHSVTVARYDTGLSKFETRWGTFTDPWTHQPQPRCGFVVVGSAGTISSYDYADTIRIQTRQRPEGYEQPVDPLTPPETDGISYFLDAIRNGRAVEGPLSPEICRVAQQIVDTAARSAAEKRTLPLIDR